MGKLRIKQIHLFATEVASAINADLAGAGVTDAIAAEATIARTAEQANSNAISTELVRAVDAEETLSTNLVSEAGTARAAELANSKAISTELVRAVTAENGISSDLVSEAGTARAAELANSKAISTELVRATGVEGDLSAEIVTEKGRLDLLLLDADGTLDTFKEISDFITTLDTNDISGLITADNDLSKSISTELVRAVDAEETLSTNLVSEAGTARAAELANSKAISTELVRAVGVEGELSDAIDALGDEYATDIELANAISTEVVDRDLAIGVLDNALSSDIVSEAGTARAAELANSKAISTELVRAVDVEGDLSDAIVAVEADIAGFGFDSVETFAFEIVAGGFKSKTAVQVGANDELDIFVNGLQVHRADQSGADVLARAATEGWVSANGIDFTVQNLGYDLEDTDHIIISGKVA